MTKKKEKTIPDIIDGIQEGRPYHFWDKHPKLNDLKAFLLCTAGAFMIAFVINSFVSTAGLFPGGFAGLTLLITRSAEKFMGVNIPYSLIYIPLNAVPIMIGIRHLGKRFTALSVYVIVLSSFLVDLLPQYAMTYDVLLLSVFGGIIDGAAVSLCLYSGACGGGTDFISLYFAEKRGVDTWNYILMANVVILSIAGLMFGWQKALYSIVYQFCVTQTLHTLFNRYSAHTLIIVTNMPEAVYNCIYTLTHHAATLYKGTGLYDNEKRSTIYSVVSSEEVDYVVKRIKEIDEHAFVNVLKTEQLLGSFYRHPNR
ncbi:MAG: YitT family protein [Eubacterium sp.]|nr:YitT family protein [Eubacterium sp.]